MSNFNQVILMGNLTRKPSISYTPNQTAVVDFGLAVNRKWTKQDGSQGEEVLFVECQGFGKRAEVISRYFDKGSPIFVQGRLKLEQWEKDGVKQSRMRVIIDNFEFISGKADTPSEK